MADRSILDGICPACRATCGLSAPKVAEISALCDPHREYAERSRVNSPLTETAVQWRSVGERWQA